MPRLVFKIVAPSCPSRPVYALPVHSAPEGTAAIAGRLLRGTASAPTSGGGGRECGKIWRALVAVDEDMGGFHLRFRLVVLQKLSELLAVQCGGLRVGRGRDGGLVDLPAAGVGVGGGIGAGGGADIGADGADIGAAFATAEAPTWSVGSFAEERRKDMDGRKDGRKDMEGYGRKDIDK